MSEDNRFPEEDGRAFGEEERDTSGNAQQGFYQESAQQGIYKEGTHQQRGEYRDPETDFYKTGQQSYQQQYRDPYQDSYQDPYQSAYQEQYQSVSQGFGIASLAVGIVSMVLFCSCINIPLAILAIVFGVIQLTKEGSRKGMAIGGIVTGVISLLAFVVFCIGIWGSVDFREGFERGLQESIEEQLEDGYFRDYGAPDNDGGRYSDDYGFPDEDDDRIWDEDDDRIWDEDDDRIWNEDDDRIWDDDEDEDDFMDTF